jgi:hypothetical protein
LYSAESWTQRIARERAGGSTVAVVSRTPVEAHPERVPTTSRRRAGIEEPEARLEGTRRGAKLRRRRADDMGGILS